jgi:flagellum-specific ATP synthase
MNDVTSREQQQLAGRFKELLATYKQSEDLINIGAYKAGSNSKIDIALSRMNEMISFIKQDIHDGIGMEQSLAELRNIFPEGVVP